MPINPIKYFLYARKSSEAEDRQAASIEQQIDELQKIVKQLKLKVVEIFTESQSAKQPGRPVFNKMLERLSKGEAGAILCWKLDRLARNPIDGGQISWLLQKGVLQQIQCYDRAYYPSDNVLMLQLEFGMANQYIRDLSVNVKRGLAKKVQDGWIPSLAPIGYLNSPDREKGFKTIIKDPVRFPLVKRLWDLMLTGKYTMPKLWIIAKEQLKLTTVKHKTLGGKYLTKSGVYRLLTNPFYYGWFEYPEGCGQWYKGHHKPMITKAEFDEVQSSLGRRNLPKPKEHLFAFTGLIRCSSCGCSITAESKKKQCKNGNVHRYVYYHCTKKKLDVVCREPSVEVKNLESQIQERLLEIETSEEFNSWALEYLHEVRKTATQSSEVALDIKQRELAEVEQQISSLTLNFTAVNNQTRELIPEQEYQALRTSLLKQKDQLKEELNKKGEELGKWVELSERAFNFACYASVWFKKGTEEDKKAILKSLGSNLFISDKKLSISLYFFHQFFIDYEIGNNKENSYARTQEKNVDKRKNRVLDPVNSTWLPLVNDVITYFRTNPEYIYIYKPNENV
jgi:DNA invertase Pin-like site-specific DNA recombinase